MGSIVGKAMDENMKKQQEFMVANQKTMLERQIQMQNQMRERQFSMMIARSRDMFMFYSGFFGFVVAGSLIGFAKKKPAAILPLIPFGTIWLYQYDLAYGSKLVRCLAEANRVMDEESSLLNLPHDVPTLASIEAARLKNKLTGN